MACVGGAAAAPLLGLGPTVGQAGAAAAGPPDATGAPTMHWATPKGPDLDGDGDPDVVNPTGKGMRVADAFGYGAYHASRDGGAREHEGADFMALAGQTIVAPISGYVTKIGYAYNDDPSFRYVELTNPAIGYVARVFYVDALVAVGDTVRLGKPIGASMTLQGRYPGITDHVHVELTRIGQGHVDPATLIPTPVLEPVRRGRR